MTEPDEQSLKVFQAGKYLPPGTIWQIPTGTPGEYLEVTVAQTPGSPGWLGGWIFGPNCVHGAFAPKVFPTPEAAAQAGLEVAWEDAQDPEILAAVRNSSDQD